MNSNFKSWLERNGFGEYLSTFDDAGYHSMEDMKSLSEGDAKCVAEEEICMLPDHAKQFVACYKTCGDPDTETPDSTEGLPIQQPADAPSRRMGYGLPAYAARTYLECLPPVNLVRMGLANHAWRDLVKALSKSSPILCERFYLLKLKSAAAKRDEVELDRLLRQAPAVIAAAASSAEDADNAGHYSLGTYHSKAQLQASAQHLMSSVTEFRVAQEHLALERVALTYVEDALRSGLPTAHAIAAHEEAVSLGLGTHPKVHALAEVCFGSKGGGRYDNVSSDRTGNDGANDNAAAGSGDGSSGGNGNDENCSAAKAAKAKTAALEKREEGWRNKASPHAYYNPHI